MSENEIDAREKMRGLFQDFSFEVITHIFDLLDLLLSRCNSFEDFKKCVKQTVDNLNKEE